MLKAAGESGIKVSWYTFFAQGIGSPQAIKQSGLLPNSVYELYETYANVPSPAYQDEEKRFRAVVGSGQTIMYPGAVNAMQVFTREADELKTLDVTAIMKGLEGKHFTPLAGGEGWIRKEDHQVFQPLYVASFGPPKEGQAFDEENTGWGWRGEGKIEAKDTVLPTTCNMRWPN